MERGRAGLSHRSQAFGCLLFLITLAGCGSGLHGPNISAGQFTSYLKDFEDASEKYASHRYTVVGAMKVEVTKIASPGVMAICVKNFFLGNKIQVDPDAWAMGDEDDHESLMFHELSHCVLGRKHDDTRMDWVNGEPVGGTSYPESLMNTHFVSGSLFVSYRSHYLSELFAGK